VKNLVVFIRQKSISTILLAVTTLIAPFFNIPNVKAEVITTYTIEGSIVNFREAPDASSAKVLGDGFYFPDGAAVTYLATAAAGNGCQDPWYNVSYVYNSNTYSGYVCSTFVNVTSYDNGNRVPTTEYEQYLKDQGFPASYWDKLSSLHSTHPNWIFKAQMTGLNWVDAIAAESNIPANIYNTYNRIDSRVTGGNVGYRSTDSSVYNWATDTWIPLESGIWYAANTETVSYYMDPRNFLDSAHVFMFESLSYQAYQNESVVKAILPAGSYYNLDDYATYFITAGSTYHVSPAFLAARVRQEGAYNTKSASGQQISCTSSSLVSDLFYGKGYWFSGSSYYNLFNIHATGDDVTCTAVAWASNGYNYLSGTFLGDGTYGRPWNTIPKAINGGAQFLAEGYIGVGQDTLYSQKFDIVGPYYYNRQYMTNVQAPYTEGYSAYNGYVDSSIISATADTSTFTFNIPVYNGMPESTALPVNANPNSYLKSLTIDGVPVKEFNYDTTTYNYVLPTASTSLSIKASTINSGATIDGTGNIPVLDITNKINIVVTAANGKKTTYTINVTKSDIAPISIPSVITNMKLTLSNNYINGILIGTDASEVIAKAKSTSPLVTATVTNNSGNIVTSGAVGTGFTVSIGNSQTTSTYTIIERGDTNGDAAINIKDLLIVQKHLLKSSTLSGAYHQGADIDKNGNIDIKDLLLVQKHLLGVSSITQ
jgi:beta-N-acetylglucosaminidase